MLAVYVLLHRAHVLAAARAAVEMFLKSPDATAREKELIKAIPENELVQCIIGDVKARRHCSSPSMRVRLVLMYSCRLPPRGSRRPSTPRRASK
jgi:hypothetical protein